MGIMSLQSKQSVNLLAGPRTAQPTGFTDVVGASFDATMDNFRVNSESAVISELTNDRDKKYKELTGRDIYEDASAFLEDPDSLRNRQTGGFSPNNAQVQEATDKLLNQLQQENRFSGEMPLNSISIRESAKKRAQQSLSTQAQVMAGATSGDRFLGGLVGGFGAMMFDPLNLLSMPFGAGAGRTLLKTIAIEASLNAGVEVASQPFVAEWQNEVGNKYGFLDAAENVGMAAMFGAAIPLGVKSVQVVPGVVSKIKTSGPEIFQGMRDRLKRFGRHEEATAAEYLGRKAHIDESDVSLYNPDIDANAHKIAMDEANAAIVNGRPLNPDNIKLTDADIKKIDINDVPDGLKRFVQQMQEDDVPIKKPVPEESVNPIFKEESPVRADLERQREIEEFNNSPEAIRAEDDSFRQLIDEDDTPQALDFTLDEAGELAGTRSAKDYLKEFENDKDYLDAISACGLKI